MPDPATRPAQARPDQARPDKARRQSESYWGLRSALVTFGVAAAAMAVAVVVKALMLSMIGANAGFLIYIPAVAVVAWYRGMLGGVLATLLGALADSVLFIPAFFGAAAILDSIAGPTNSTRVLDWMPSTPVTPLGSSGAVKWMVSPSTTRVVPPAVTATGDRGRITCNASCT